MAVETTLQLQIKCSSAFEIKDKQKALVDLSKLSTDALKKLAELSKSNKAISQIENNFEFIKSFIS